MRHSPVGRLARVASASADSSGHALPKPCVPTSDAYAIGGYEGVEVCLREPDAAPDLDGGELAPGPQLADVSGRRA